MTRKLILGTANFGLKYGLNNPQGQLTREQVRDVLLTAWAEGIRILDTATAYGESETVIGSLLKELCLDFRINTKVASASEAIVAKELQSSLLRIGRTFHGTVLLHNYEAYSANQKLYEDLIVARDEGIVEKAGFFFILPGAANAASRSGGSGRCYSVSLQHFRSEVSKWI